MSQKQQKINNYKELRDQIDKQFNIFMSELQVIKKQKYEILKKIDSIIAKNKLNNIRKKYLNN
ncbi:MAG: hypothetical protein PHH83_02630 [Patescibacteria group bacterium]|nr:hypothetical protein [Patescibacteria group bacterium]